MKHPIFYCFILFTLCAATVSAQDNIVKSLETPVAGEGKVTVHQDARIEALLGVRRGADGSDAQVKVQGYRVQVYAGGNSRASKTEAEGMAAKVKEYFPELSVYKSFIPPRWLCRVGDFRSVEEADAVMRKLRGTGAFRSVSIVRDTIILYY
ncbi:SPOR domain-containing protein [Bacteroides sp. 224]|uniref:SPOR domain-containing protein n=1 Tax=Bacteroides sp. 224 TaxID=2302936 RepID=UPI0013D0AC9A|nr:SPOR domain-containing protein [Bacteroides sp. 224]NDV66363.1 SPOR domain-containing protein [Bacteroides sp. 224]